MENVLDNVSVASSQAVNAVLANKASESASSKFRPFIIYSPLVIYFMHKTKVTMANFLNIYSAHVNRSFFEHSFIPSACDFLPTHLKGLYIDIRYKNK